LVGCNIYISDDREFVLQSRHTGVGVYGKEYFFGGGIQSVPLGRSPYGVPVQVIDLGYTEVPKDYFEEYLDEIRPRFTHETYNIVHHNCNNFSDEVSQFLVGSGIPQHILHLPAEVLNSPMGAMLSEFPHLCHPGSRDQQKSLTNGCRSRQQTPHKSSVSFLF
jgi:hypothetical protein